MKKRILTLTCILLMMNAGPAAAAPALNGMTGEITTPSADVLHTGQFSLGYYRFADGNSRAFDASIACRWEIGAVNFNYDNHTSTSHLNVKYALARETLLKPGLAIGAEDIGGDGKRSLYAVMSKQLPFGYRLHMGIGNGRFSGPFGAVEKTLTPLHGLSSNNVFPATTLIVECDGRGMNYGARMAIVPGVKLDAGWRARLHSAYFGLSLTI